MEWQTGVQSTVRWGRCEAVLAWPDRIELVLGDQTSLVVRASERHRGSQALDAIRARAPRSLLVPMPHDPEPQPEVYVLRGLATSPGSALWALLLLATVVAAMGMGIGVSEGRTSAVLVGAVFALGGAFVSGLWSFGSASRPDGGSQRRPVEGWASASLGLDEAAAERG